MAVVAACGGAPDQPAPVPSTSLPVSTTGTEESTDDRIPGLTTTTVTSSPATTGEVPREILDAIVADATERTEVPQSDLSVVRSEAVEWPDSSLGCPEPGQFYTQAIVSGYWVEIGASDRILDYRSDAAGNFKVCDRLGPPPTLPDR